MVRLFMKIIVQTKFKDEFQLKVKKGIRDDMETVWNQTYSHDLNK